MAQAKIWVVSDTHFGHRRVLEFEPAYRPFSSIEVHDAVLVEFWNSKVNDRDTVWHLGDVAFGRQKLEEIMPQLKGTKNLIMGNHDHYDISLYKRYFNKVLGSAKVKECLLTHIPIHPSEFYRWKLNVHGHLHSKQLMKENFWRGKYPDERYFNASVENTGLAPILLDDIREQRGLRKNAGT